MATQKHFMETYHGIIRAPADAIKLFEACRLGLLPRVQRRLSEKERQAIRSGSVFVWDEREAGMRRWTDGKSWSASRVSGSFLTYREMEGKRGGGFNTLRRVPGKTPDSSGRGSDEDQDDGEPDGYRYKVDGLMKQSFSITTSSGQHLHLISYYARPGPGEPELPLPTSDPTLRSVIPIKGMYPESSLTDSTPVQAVSRVPMPQQQQQHHHHHHHHQPAHYAHHLPPPPLSTSGGGPHLSPYSQQGYTWPPSPIATPPYNHHYTTTSAPYSPQQQSLPPPPQHQQQQQQQNSRTPPPPPPPGFFSNQQTLPLPTLPPYGNGAPPPPSSQYDRLSLPLPQSSSASRTTPPMHSSYGQGAPSSSNMSNHQPTNSPRSAYRQPPPLLPPVTSAPSSATGVSSYQTSPGARTHLPPVSGPFSAPLPSTAMASSMATATATTSGGPSAPSSPYQQRKTHSNCSDGYANGTSPTSAGGHSNKASLSALLHPTPSTSEPNSAHAGSTNSAGSSPRHLGPPPLAGPATISNGTASNGSTSGGALSLMPQQFLQPAPSGEDSRALSRLDQKLSI
ncbi:cyclic-AMP independent regulatory protein [Niveomyces insectorum RCEF 264]|uniref:Cyclic-AMP independent regulatory protein n=1 Tax=Niveomyces insectorum RCEF 264 TaxID=1081102 RepID=A0A167XQQ2_9HYPO|nr:cyclic-AMP independent regulatory protein [Niveomyces insectorum RCEF 264]